MLTINLDHVTKARLIKKKPSIHNWVFYPASDIKAKYFFSIDKIWEAGWYVGGPPNSPFTTKADLKYYIPENGVLMAKPRVILYLSDKSTYEKYFETDEVANVFFAEIQGTIKNGYTDGEDNN